MKKTVSINIGGIIFHIEEDGYEMLKTYLDSINGYFSTFEDSAEIISDIESRIAEIFLEKLSEGRQTVNIDDVKELKVTMGTIADFEATIETEPTENPTADTEKEAEAEPETSSKEAGTRPKKLYRDSRRRLLGGVASGIAHYFGIDPLWTRLLFLVLFINLFLPGFSGATLLGYIILWIVLPSSSELEEDKKIKKLFRNSDERVLGGVASGIASYFGTDIAVIRLLFVLSIFLGGAGLILYIILWIITPEARTITEKMQMQGEPVTLSNIETNVKKGLNVKEGEETPIVKILLFPFRLIAMVITTLGKLLGPILKFLAEAIRILFGVLLVIIGASLMLGFLVLVFGILGIGTWEGAIQLGLPLELITRSVDPWPVVSTFLVSFIPALALTLLGLVVILKRRVTNAYVGWSLFALWAFALILSMFSVPNFARQFSTEKDIRIDKVFEVSEKVPTIRLNDLGDNHWDAVDLQLRGHRDSAYQMIVSIESRGKDRDEAESNARSIVYSAVRQGDDFVFDSKITYPKDAKYRFQQVNVVFYIPYGKEFHMEEEITEILSQRVGGSRYSNWQIDESETWIFERNGLKCISCTSRFDRDEELRSRAPKKDYDDQVNYPFEDFDELRVASYFEIDIRQGEDWMVRVSGNDDELDDVYLNQVGDRLEVKYREDTWEWWGNQKKEKPSLLIVMPELDYIELVGNCGGEIRGFRTNNIDIDLTGASDVYIDVDPEKLGLNLTGASKVTLRGSARRLNAELVGASSLEAFRFDAERVNLSAVGASKAEIFGTEEMDIDAAGVSKVRYRGTDNVRVNKAGVTSVERD